MIKLAIVILLTSLLTTTWVSSSPSEGGANVVVVESDGTTKVLISPQDDVVNPKQTSNDRKPIFSGPRDLICDTYGKCTHKIANVLAKTREKVAETAHRVSDKATDLAGDAVNIVGAPKDLAKTHEKVMNTAHRVSDKAAKIVGDAMDIVRDGASKEFDVVDSPKRIVEDIAGNATDEIKEHVNENKKGIMRSVLRIGQFGERGLKDIMFKLNNLVGEKMHTNSVGSLIHMLGFSTAYGMCVWVTFVSSYILGRCVPRQMFRVVQRRVYKVYFRAMCYCVCAALLGHLVSQKGEILSRKMGLFQSLCLLSALLMVLTNMVFLEPKATKAMYERMKLEKEEGRGRGVVVAAKDGMMDSGAKMVKAKGGMMDGMMDGGGATVVKAKDGRMDGMMDGGGAKIVKDGVMNGGGAKVVKAKDGMMDGMMDGSGAKVMKAVSVAEERRDVLRLNEKLKRLNAYSSTLNLSTLVVLTWHVAYMGQLLQAA